MEAILTNNHGIQDDLKKEKKKKMPEVPNRSCHMPLFETVPQL